MSRFVQRLRRPELGGLLLLALLCPRALGADDEMGGGAYIGVFGGVSATRTDHMSQVGNALFAPADGGPLAVFANGAGGTRATGIVGGHIGYEGSGWCVGSEGSGWYMRPAAEFEGFYLGGIQKGDLFNPTTRLPEHDFLDTFPMDNGIFLTNVVLNLESCSGFAVYAGGGFGAATVNISGADSLQVAPPEMGVNHFNSGPDSSNWGFAAQGKVGVRVPLTEHVYLFTEYRFLYVSGTTFTFGPTVSPGHAPTTPWTVHFGDMFNNAAVAGVGIKF